jgi:hypothetical protein
VQRRVAAVFLYSSCIAAARLTPAGVNISSSTHSFPHPEDAMKRLAAFLILFSFATGCASTRLSNAEELAMYRAHAGEPVRDFHYPGSLNGWTPLGDRALAVWASPSRAYLLDLMGPCSGLEFAFGISITNQMGTVSSRFDEVVVRDRHSALQVPCRIQEIRPLDVKGLRQAQRELRQVEAVQRPQ